MRKLPDVSRSTWWRGSPRTRWEKHLAETRRLKAVTIGNPLHKYHGRWSALHCQRASVWNIVLTGEFVCDFSLQAANDALSNKAELHASYFRTEPTAHDIRVVDVVAELLAENV